MFEAIEYSEALEVPNQAPKLHERRLGVFATDQEAVAAGRAARQAFQFAGRRDYAWWIVREQGARYAIWIADSRDEREFVLDLQTGRLIEV